MAGATTTGQVARYAAISRLSHIPFAIFAGYYSSGAISMISPNGPASWLASRFTLGAGQYGIPGRVWKVIEGVTKSFAAGVITIFTSAPALTSNRVSMVIL